jgi:hypothetical protein
MGGGFVSGLLQRSKLFFGQSALEKENAVHVSMGFVVVVNGGDELKVSAYSLSLNLALSPTDDSAGKVKHGQVVSLFFLPSD